MLQKFLFAREVVIVLGLDAAEWFKETPWAHQVAALLCVVAFYLLLGVVGAIERMPL